MRAIAVIMFAALAAWIYLVIQSGYYQTWGL